MRKTDRHARGIRRSICRMVELLEDKRLTHVRLQFCQSRANRTPFSFPRKSSRIVAKLWQRCPLRGVRSTRSREFSFPAPTSASSVPSSAVVLRMSRVGLTSTRSSAISEAGLGNHLHQQVRFAVVEAAFDRRSDTGRNRRIADVEVERHVHAGGSAQSRPRRASAATAATPSRSMSFIVKTCTPEFRTRSFSRSSRLRTPISAVCCGSTVGEKPPIDESSAGSGPSSAASGMPCTLPLGVLAGVFMSPCASIHSKPEWLGRRRARERPTRRPTRRRGCDRRRARAESRLLRSTRARPGRARSQTFAISLMNFFLGIAVLLCFGNRRRKIAPIDDRRGRARRSVRRGPRCETRTAPCRRHGGCRPCRGERRSNGRAQARDYNSKKALGQVWARPGVQSPESTVACAFQTSKSRRRARARRRSSTRSRGRFAVVSAQRAVRHGARRGSRGRRCRRQRLSGLLRRHRRGGDGPFASGCRSGRSRSRPRAILHISTDYYHEPQVALGEALAEIAPVGGRARRSSRTRGQRRSRPPSSWRGYHTKRFNIIAFLGFVPWPHAGIALADVEPDRAAARVWSDGAAACFTRRTRTRTGVLSGADDAESLRARVPLIHRESDPHASGVARRSRGDHRRADSG